MPYANGGSLNSFLKKRRAEMSLADAAHVALEMSKCIDQVHQAGVVHFDIKPDNFLVCLPVNSDPESQTEINRSVRTCPIQETVIVLTDFGLARNAFLDDDKDGNEVLVSKW